MASNRVKKVKMFGVAGVTLVTVLGGLLVVYPMITEVEAIKIQVAEKVLENTTLQTRIQSLNATADQVPAIKAINDELAAQFPATADIPGLLSSLSESASTVGLGSGAFESIETSVPALIAGGEAALPSTEGAAPAEGGAPAEAPASGPVDNTDTGAGSAPAPAAGGGATATAGGDLASMTVDITITGTQAQLADFVEAVATGDRALLIKGFSIEESEDGEATLSLNAEAFLYRTLADPDAQATPADPAAPVDPAAPAPADNTDTANG